MNVEQVAGLIAYFGSAWPSWNPSDDTADIWASELEDIPVEIGRVAAKTLVQTSTFVPSIAEFREECRLETGRQRLKASFAALPATGPSPLPEDVRDDFAALRAQLSDWSAKGHNHKGPEPCPTCGSAA